MGMAKVGVANAGAGYIGSLCLDVGDVLCCSGAGFFVWVGDLGYLPAHWGDIGMILPQSVWHTDGEEIKEGN